MSSDAGHCIDPDLSSKMKRSVGICCVPCLVVPHAASGLRTPPPDPVVPVVPGMIPVPLELPVGTIPAPPAPLGEPVPVFPDPFVKVDPPSLLAQANTVAATPPIARQRIDVFAILMVSPRKNGERWQASLMRTHRQAPIPTN